MFKVALLLLLAIFGVVQGYASLFTGSRMRNDVARRNRRDVRGGRHANAPAVSMSSTVDDANKKGSGLVSKYMKALDDRPIVTKMWTSGVVCGLGDILSQGLAQGSWRVLTSTLDVPRMLIYAAIGAFYLAPLVHWWFGVLEKITSGMEKNEGKVVGKGRNLKVLRSLQMVFWDQAVAGPIVNAGFLFIFAACSGLSSGASFGSLGSIGANKVKAALWPTLKASWKIWPAAAFLNFTFVPIQLRVLFLNAVGLGWNVIMSGQCN